MPCWKLNDRFDVAQMALRVQQSGRTGWYYRVLEEGEVAAGDALELVERPYGQWSVARLSAVLFDKRLEPELLRECLALPLVPNWRRTLENAWSNAKSRTGLRDCKAAAKADGFTLQDKERACPSNWTIAW